MSLATPYRACGLLMILLVASSAPGADATSAPPPLPPPANIPKAGPVVNGIYQPQPILPGGVVVPLFPADSPYLKKEKLGEPEVYGMNGSMPGRIASIVGIHNPSIEFHSGVRSLNTGMAVIVVAGGGHNTLNVGGEGADFVHFFANYGINTIILRNRLRRDGYEVQSDAVADAQQAIKVVRGYAKQWQLDPRKIGIMGFSAGAELATAAAIKWKEFDEKNALPANPFAGVSSRPDFVGVIYPGPTPFTRPRNATDWSAPPIPRDTPPSFVVCAGWGDRGHAIWADDWFTAMLQADIPNVEMHIYARGRHPGDQPWPDDPPSTGGLTHRGGIALGTWHLRFLDWARDLRFTEKPGVPTLAEKDSQANLTRPPPGSGRGRGGISVAPGSSAAANPKSTTAPNPSAPK
ncbi:MAG TPA: alpha/beta hydrolase fold domain-containing protein [Opitutaceae bacterium]|nr:alpha/beta hydrolase fold domain-containing protein [Opitutaceae bacterium]